LLGDVGEDTLVVVPVVGVQDPDDLPRRPSDPLVHRVEQSVVRFADQTVDMLAVPFDCIYSLFV
jgi:hypothetical protein